MDAIEGNESIANDEFIFRRVPARVDFYDPTSDRPVQWITFKPNPRDSSGISVWRGKHLSPEEAVRAHARPGKAYYLIRLTVRDLRHLGAEIAATPDEGGTGHASIANLSWSRYQGPERLSVLELAKRLATQACQSQALGPFQTPYPKTNAGA